MTEELIPNEEKINIENMIYEIRGKQVMIDSDLAGLYHVKTGALNRQVQRNIERFPIDFMFQLNELEYENLKCQFGISSSEKNYGGRRTLPYVFTEQGVSMLSSVLHTKVAAEISIKIIRTFVKIRQFIKNNLLEQKYINDLVLENHESIKEISKEIKLLQEAFNKMEEKELKNKIFFNGEIFDSYLEIIKILNKSKKEIIIIDNYADEILLEIISKIDKDITLITSKKLLKNIDINKYNKQYHNLTIIKNDDFHDRFIILDKEKIYHLGSSINHIGKKVFGINIIEENSIKEVLLNKIKNMI